VEVSSAHGTANAVERCADASSATEMHPLGHACPSSARRATGAHGDALKRPTTLHVLCGWWQVFFVVQFMGETEQTQVQKDAFVQAAATDIGAVFATSPSLQAYGSITSEV
jgi:hypothetical protein